ncbi:MAG: RnfH family protein [Oleiphilaceae bacterium]|nr:RnfH family protein [Oleiphilaceae bacterium]
MSEKLNVEVAYARPDKQRILPLQVAPGTTMVEAVQQSGITRHFPEIDVASQPMGIFGQVVADPANHPLRDGDRVEIYRPLIIDPKQARLDRARRKSGRK